MQMDRHPEVAAVGAAASRLANHVEWGMRRTPASLWFR
jgi:hypothetical protein